jgi:hypothetical protein
MINNQCNYLYFFIFGVFMKVFIISVFIIAFLYSCGPSVNLELQKKIQGLSTKKIDKSYVVKGKFVAVMPFYIGQWVLTSSNNDGKISLLKTSIVGQEVNAWIIENYSITEYEETIMQYCISGMDKVYKSGDAADIEILWIKSQKDGKVEKYDGIALSIMKSMFKSGLKNLIVNISGYSDGGTVTVPAGTFSGTFKSISEVSFFGKTYTREVYCHPDIPINAMVKSISKENNFTSELLDFGLSGAVSSF